LSGEGTIYEYFDTKADIFFAAVLEWTKRMEGQFTEQLVAVDDPIDRLRAFAELSVAIVEPIDPGVARLSIDVLRHTILQDGTLYKRRHLMKEVHTGMRRIVVQILLEGISRGIFRPDVARDAEKVAINLLAYLDGISLHSLISEGDFNLREQIEFSLENVLRPIVSDRAAHRIEMKKRPIAVKRSDMTTKDPQTGRTSETAHGRRFHRL
jgi:AcrR family transcriptional regulator